MHILTIRKIRRVDIPILLEFRNSPSFIKFCTNRKFTVTLKEFIVELQSDFGKDRQVQFMIELGDKPIGTIWIYGMNDILEHAFITTFIVDSYRLKGYGIYAHCRVLQFMFEEVEIKTMYSDVYEINKLSINTIEKRGWTRVQDFTKRGIHRYKTTYSDFLNKKKAFEQRCLYIK